MEAGREIANYQKGNNGYPGSVTTSLVLSLSKLDFEDSRSLPEVSCLRFWGPCCETELCIIICGDLNFPDWLKFGDTI